MPVTPRRATLSSARRILVSLAASAAVSLATWVATALAYFPSNGASGEGIGQLLVYFLPAALALVVVASLAFALGAATSRVLAASIGVVSGFLAAFLGASITVIAVGNPIDAGLLAYVGGTLVGPHLLFVVLTGAAFAIIGVAMWQRFARGTAPRPVVLVRAPSSRLAEGELTHRTRTAVDLDLANAQWDDYVAVFADHGFEVVEAEPADHLPDSVFIEDALLVFGDLAIVTSPGAESRRPETHAARDAATALGLRVQAIELPGTLDGGDVLVVGSTVFVGSSSRTNAEGIRQLRALLAPLDLNVIAVPVSKVLHLKSAVTALPDGTVIGHAKTVEHAELFPRFLAVPEPEGAAVVVLDPETVLIAASAPKTATLLGTLGYRVITVDVSEFEKLEGCVTCLSVRIP